MKRSLEKDLTTQGHDPLKINDCGVVSLGGPGQQFAAGRQRCLVRVGKDCRSGVRQSSALMADCSLEVFFFSLCEHTKKYFFSPDISVLVQLTLKHNKYIKAILYNFSTLQKQHLNYF